MAVWDVDNDPEVCDLYGILYYLPWSDLPVGGSFFLPTTMNEREASRIIKKKARRAGIRIEVHERCEFGVLGVRVWRVPYLGSDRT